MLARGFTIVLALALALVAGAPAMAEDVLARIAARGTLIAAAVPDQLPLAARAENGDLTGFDIDVAEEIGRRLGTPVRFVTPGWEAILAGDWQDRWDISVSSITPTDERARSLAFPAVYRFDAAVVAVRREDERFAKPADASGKTLGVKAGTTFERYLKHDLALPGVERITYRIDDAAIRPYADKDEALNALAAGDVDAVVSSLATVQAAIRDGVHVRVLPGFLFFEPVAVAVQPGDPAFARRIEEIVLEMSGDGTLGRMSVAWFGIDLTEAVP